MSPGQTAGGKPGSKTSQPGRQPSAPAKGKRPPPKGSGPGQRPTSTGAGGAKAGSGAAKGRAGKTISAPPPSRLSPATMAFAAVGVVVVIVLGFVIFQVTKGGTTSSAGIGPTESPIQSSVFTAVTTTPFSLANEVGVPSTDLVSPPKVATNQPLLKIDGKPAVVFIGALFCPYCAAERWGIVIGLAPFGTWSGLQETTSSPYDTDPSTATFAFDHATFTSNYITFAPREAMSNDTTALGTRQKYQPLTPLEASLWSKYSSYFGLQGEGFPFLDIGNQVFVVAPSYDPQVLAGLTQAQIAAKLSSSNNLVTDAIMGTVNYIRAGVCHITGQQPSTVCSQSGVREATKAMGLS